MKVSLTNKRFNILLAVIVGLSFWRLFSNLNGTPMVADWMSLISAEFAMQILYNNFKEKNTE